MLTKSSLQEDSLKKELSIVYRAKRALNSVNACHIIGDFYKRSDQYLIDEIIKY